MCGGRGREKLRRGVARVDARGVFAENEDHEGYGGGKRGATHVADDAAFVLTVT